MMKFTNILFALVLIGTSVSCSDYNKIVKGDDYAKKLEKANALYDKGMTPKYDKNGSVKKDRFGDPVLNSNDLLRSITLYEQVYQKMPKTGEGELAYFRIGKAYYHGGDFYMAGYYLGAFSQRFPYSIKAQEALFLSALCSVHSSPEHSLDQNETELAINNLQQFVNTYPESVLVDSCNHTIDRLRYKLELKDYDAVKLYSKTENYRAAVTAAMTFNEDYPRSRHKEEMSYLLVRNSYYLSLNSIDNKKKERIEQTIERYRTFVAEFPESSYKKEVNDINDVMHKELQKL